MVLSCFRDRCTPAAARIGAGAAHFGVGMLVFGVLLAGVAIPRRSVPSQRAELPPLNVEDQEEILSPPQMRFDSFHIVCARKQLLVLTRARAHLASARSVAEYRWWQRLRTLQGHAYRLTYLEVTPAGRRLADLPAPDGP